MENMTFEMAIKRLENIVKDLEMGDLSLEESIKVFEEGIKLSLFCRKELEKADARIKQLLRNAQGEIELVDFDLGED
ncbi:exodeoxyribonuclease VII small subunit [Thermosyntropha sp.]|uniref:exodeoxyribonuclease VII small subunit n=1 Tax=Thermosyntropha sp. TaxID=2740820 RepID=UPI0025FC513F|nr:exodeoxyribonuclease VII small subunit [Thermosyntropha sp.]MBO8159192.1 exodeoxyribonuclease VII small subunit [Thermosyntropha sp.]